MMRSSLRLNLLKATALTCLVLFTRSGHFGSAIALPDASLAAFFLAGLWLQGFWGFALLLGVAGLADQIAFAEGVSDWCMSPAYGFLIPAYACLWWAGRTSRKLQWRRRPDLLRSLGYFLAATSAAFVISTGSFFLLSDYFREMSPLVYWRESVHDFPAYASWALAYALAGVIAAETLRHSSQRRATARSVGSGGTA